MLRASNTVCLILLVVFGTWLAAPRAAIGDEWLVALERRDWVAIKDLTRQGANVNRPSKKGASALMRAAADSRADVVELLLQANADVNATNPLGGTALMYACKAGDRASVNLLLTHGSEVNANSINGWTPIMLAAVKGHDDIIEMLLQRGADPNSADIYGWTPLMRSVERNRPKSVRALLTSQATVVNARNEHGATALHYAVARGDVDMARWLVERGADMSAEDRAGRTPLDMANGRGHRAMEKFLEYRIRLKQQETPGYEN